MKPAHSARFGRYEILGELGRGSMGVVYKGRDPKINREVAIKAIAFSGQTETEESEFRERFFREAEAAGRLSHPGIVTIFDVGEDPKTRTPYIVMEYVSGQSMDKVLSEQGGKIPLAAALQLVQELAEALDCAHGQGVVHRDLKPANILLTPRGHAKISDFGVAKLNTASLTVPGQLLGTPAFMAPEQLNDEIVDGRSDLFSLGTILYTIATGHIPFHGNSVMTVCLKVVSHDPLRATVFDTDLPAGLDHIIQRAMAKDPGQRYQRGMEMALDLEELRKGREPWSKSMPGCLAAGESAPEIGPPEKKYFPTANYNNASQLEEDSVPYNSGQMSTRGGAITSSVFSRAVWTALGIMAIVGGSLATMYYQRRQLKSGNAIASPITSAISAAADATKIPVARVVPAPVKKAATLDLEVRHHFRSASLSLWVDNQLSRTYHLQAPTRKGLSVFRNPEGSQSYALGVSPGKHSVRVQVRSLAGNYDQSAGTARKFASGEVTVLQVNFDKHDELRLQ